jgi:serine/threonine-protein phosphatase 2A regulatory subunit A
MEGQNENDELYPIAVLIDELKVSTFQFGRWYPNSHISSTTMSFSDSMPFTVYPRSRLHLGPTELGRSSSHSLMVRLAFNRLTPHLTVIDSVEDEDEVLTALSEELGNFTEYVGGAKHGHVLLSPLENLAAIEEPLVREKVPHLLKAFETNTDVIGR